MTNNIEIGTRALTEDEINNFFPQYNELLKEIDTLRQTKIYLIKIKIV